MKIFKVAAAIAVSAVALSSAFIAGVHLGNAQSAASIRTSATADASRLVAILRHVDAGGESCHTALERELDNALIRTGYGTGVPELSPLSRAYLREAAAYRKEHPYALTHSYTGYVRSVLDLASGKS